MGWQRQVQRAARAEDRGDKDKQTREVCLWI